MIPVFFVLPAKFRRKWSPALNQVAQGQCTVDDAASSFTSGVDVWLLQTWMLLRQVDSPYSFHLVEKAVPNEINVFHYDTATSEYGVATCFSVVIRADRPPVFHADIVVEQNPARQNVAFYIPHWTQPGLIPRNPNRGDRLEQLAVVGRSQYYPQFLSDPDFLQELEKLNIKLVFMDTGNWSDFRNIDAVLALRPDVSPRVLETKPPSKLFNAWTARTPALIGAEPACQALRTDPLDYLEICDSQSVLSALRQLKTTPNLYSAMRDRCVVRAKKCTRETIRSKWIALFDYAYKKKKKRSKFSKIVCYQVSKIYASLLRETGLWRD